MRVTCEMLEDPRGTVWVQPTGHLEAVGSTQLWENISDRLTDDTPRLLIDLSKVDFLSSAGVGILIRLLTRAQQLGGGLAVYGCSPRVRTVLQIVNLEEVLNLRDTHEEALDRLRDLTSG